MIKCKMKLLVGLLVEVLVELAGALGEELLLGLPLKQELLLLVVLLWVLLELY